MISIRRSVTELEQCHEVRDLALDCYVKAIRNISHYAVELDDTLSAPHRKHLAVLADEVTGAQPETLVESRSVLRGLLRAYRDKAAEYLRALRDELSGTARALEEILESFTQADGDHESSLRTALGHLHQISTLPEAASLRAAVIAATETIEQSLEQIRKQHQLTVSQFLVEIRMLHKRIDTLESAAAVDGATRLFNRHEIEDRITSSGGGRFCLLLIRVNGFRKALVQFDATVATQLVGAFAKRLQNGLPADSVLGRWSEEEFLAVLTGETSEAMEIAKALSQQLAGSYACLQGGRTVRPALQISAAVLGSAGDSPDHLLKRIGEFLIGN
jgi:GGDEF domain-containing protein